MKYLILLAMEVTADPADLGGAAKKAFKGFANLVNSGDPIQLHLVPEDESPEAILARKVLDSSFKATSKPS